jgi:hypothetical protein
MSRLGGISARSCRGSREDFDVPVRLVVRLMLSGGFSLRRLERECFSSRRLGIDIHFQDCQFCKGI